MKIWGITDIGLIRKDNQDSYGIVEQTASGHTLCVVCDGMGGAAAGEMASRIAVETFLREIQQILREDATAEQIQEMASYAISLANKEIREYAAQHTDCLGMGTTLVSAIAKDGCVVISNVGDSRAYHISNDDIARVTKDHSLVESMVDRGDITAEEARRHPKHLPKRSRARHRGRRSPYILCPTEPSRPRAGAPAQVPAVSTKISFSS